MLPRYDLFGDPTYWLDNIKQTSEGSWYRAKDIDPILEQFVAMGGVIPDALYPDGEAIGVRAIDSSGPYRPQSRGTELLGDTHTIDDYTEELQGFGGNNRYAGDGEAGALPAGGGPLRDWEE